METLEEMERELNKMQYSILEIQRLSPLANYNNLCTSFTRLVETFDKLKNGP